MTTILSNRRFILAVRLDSGCSIPFSKTQKRRHSRSALDFKMSHSETGAVFERKLRPRKPRTCKINAGSSQRGEANSISDHSKNNGENKVPLASVVKKEEPELGYWNEHTEEDSELAIVPKTSPETSPNASKKKKRRLNSKVAGRKGGKRVKSETEENCESDEKITKDVEDPPCFSKPEIEFIGKSLLQWYDKSHRELAWRRNKLSCKPGLDASLNASFDLSDQSFAYHVWVSEIMLQQTQVATVIAYFKKWMEKWPTVQKLAEATLEEVHEVWAGLGYYRRAGYLLKGAQYIVNQLEGSFPEAAKDLLKIPGVGRYTSAAIASIVFNEKIASVDGNVIRVVSRLRALEGDPKKLTELHHRLGNEMLDKSRPGDFNQAVMELGATVCKPSNPDCSNCPISSTCKAHLQYTHYLKTGGSVNSENCPHVTQYPNPTPKQKKRDQTVAVCVLKVIECTKDGDNSVGNTSKDATSSPPPPNKETATNGFYLMVKRPAEGLLGGLWEFPTVSEITDQDYGSRMAAVNELLNNKFGMVTDSDNAKEFKVVDRSDVGQVEHIFTHVRMTLFVEELVVEGNRDWLVARKGVEVKWVEQGEMSKQALSTMVKKVWKLVSMESSKDGKDGNNKKDGKKGKRQRNVITNYFQNG